LAGGDDAVQGLWRGPRHQYRPRTRRSIAEYSEEHSALLGRSEYMDCLAEFSQEMIRWVFPTARDLLHLTNRRTRDKKREASEHRYREQL